MENTEGEDEQHMFDATAEGSHGGAQREKTWSELQARGMILAAAFWMGVSRARGHLSRPEKRMLLSLGKMLSYGGGEGKSHMLSFVQNESARCRESLDVRT